MVFPMTDGLATKLEELRKMDKDTQEAVEEVVSEGLADTELISVQAVNQGTIEGSVNVKLDYEGLRDRLSQLEEFNDLDVSIHSGDIYVKPEGNP
jgi:predicted ATPase